MVLKLGVSLCVPCGWWPLATARFVAASSASSTVQSASSGVHRHRRGKQTSVCHRLSFVSRAPLIRMWPRKSKGVVELRLPTMMTLNMVLDSSFKPQMKPALPKSNLLMSVGGTDSPTIIVAYQGPFRKYSESEEAWVLFGKLWLAKSATQTTFEAG